jgi:hypothetical protein
LNELTEEFDQEAHVESSMAPSKSPGNILAILEAREGMYVKALSTSKANNDTSKARRLDRQLKVSVNYATM